MQEHVYTNSGADSISFSPDAGHCILLPQVGFDVDSPHDRIEVMLNAAVARWFSDSSSVEGAVLSFELQTREPRAVFNFLA